MNRNSLLIIFLVIILGISSLTGCGGGGGDVGGGGGGVITPENSLSSDYFGLEVNYTLNYNCSYYDVEADPKNLSCNKIYTVLSEDSGVFKTQNTYPIDPGYAYGDFIEKHADGNYYYRGEWETGEDDYNHPISSIMITNPVKIGDTSWEYGEVIDRKNVTVPAGTFYAWVFQEVYVDGINRDEYTYYFVENIGVVYYTYRETEAGVPIDSATESLTSYYLSPSASSASLVNRSVNISATSNTSLKLKRILRNRK